MQGAKKISVGDTVWALWPGSRRYYEATVLDVGKNTVQVDFKDGFTTEVALRQVYVRLISELFVSCCPCRLLNYGTLRQIIVGCLDRCSLSRYLENEFAILIALLLFDVFTCRMNFHFQGITPFAESIRLY